MGLFKNRYKFLGAKSCDSKNIGHLSLKQKDYTLKKCVVYVFNKYFIILHHLYIM